MYKELHSKFPLIKKMADGEEVLWFNPHCNSKLSPAITTANVEDAAARLARFAPYIRRAFPQTAENGGIIESPLQDIPLMKKLLSDTTGTALSGKLMLKCDNLLPISGSIKARGGIYEVLWFAEKVALESGMLMETDDYSVLDDEKFRKLFSGYSLAVGSTGNLGLSIGIMGTRLGFHVSVHMSADARQWKKDLLREKGANVVEYAGDYQKAVTEGRKQTESDPLSHFIDDENSLTLFLGYAVAAGRLKKQLDQQGIVVNREHPLFVYLPCGVGGGPGGVSYGLKQIYGENVRCFFAEPVQAPCMLLGVMTGLHDKISVQDIGLTGKTTADGLAVGKPSKLVGKIAGNILDGLFTVADFRMDKLVTELYKQEKIFVEPSAAAGFPGYYLIQKNQEYGGKFDRETWNNSTHIVWATGGGMVPEEERGKYISAK